MLNLQITLIFIAIAAIILFGFIYSYNKNKVSLHKPLDKTDKLILICLLIPSLCIFFARISSFTPYKSMWTAQKPGDKLVLTFNKPERVAKIFYEIDYTKGDYSIYTTINSKKVFFLNIEKSEMLQLAKKMTRNSCNQCFRYNQLNINKELPISTITIEAQSIPINLGEILILDKNNHVIKYSINKKPYFNSDSIIQKSLSPNYVASRSNLVYDEFYYVGSSYQYLHNIIPDMGEQPQLPVLATALSSKIFGFSTFAWRIIPNLMGILMVLIMYIFVLRLFKNKLIAFTSSILLLIDPMHLVITNLALLDPYMTFFLFFEYYFLWSYYNSRLNGITFKDSSINLLYTGIFLGLAASSKWNALFSVTSIIFVISYCELLNKETSKKILPYNFLICILNLILLPTLIYIATYIPISRILTITNLFKFVFYQQILMYKNLTTVPHLLWFQSKPWQWLTNNITWPLTITPNFGVIFSHQFFEWHYINVKHVSLISFFISPCLLGIFAISLMILFYRSFKKDLAAKFILLAIIAQYTPYLLLKRYGFIYYFYSIIPFIILGTSYLFYTIKKVYTHGNKIILIFLITNIVVFIWFLPIIFSIPYDGKIIMMIFDSIQLVTLISTAIYLIYGFWIYRKLK